MKGEFKKYQHILVPLFALIAYFYIVEPLYLYAKELHQTNQLLARKVVKGEKLVDSKDTLDDELSRVTIQYNRLEPFIFQKGSENDVKLEVQKKLESFLANAQCELKRFSWEGKPVQKGTLIKWSLNLRYEGSPFCLTTMTKQLDSAMPLFVVDSFFYQDKRIDGNPRNRIPARLDVTFYQISGGDVEL
ncbi:hypothetical protein [Pseudoalteromonas pernae]|uniref:hypothetical protein n=1 Tax=Pseudoalteromonas pernae TaxID=3118054 RepID=UPI0032420A14